MDQDDHYLAGKLLIAMPQMGDPRFAKAVIYVCAHDKNGAMGLVINYKLPHIEFSNVLDQLKLESDIEIDFNHMDLPIMSGGPVEGSRGFLLHSSDFAQKDTIKVNDEIAVTGTVDALVEVATGQGPKDLLFILGYAGWSAGQLDSEIQQNAWLVVEPDAALIFHDNIEEKWGLAIAKLGIDPHMLSAEGGRA